MTRSPVPKNVLGRQAQSTRVNRELPANWVGTAEFSECRKYRYVLGRTWGSSPGRALFIMLNPSTADATTNDPSVAKCCYYAKKWGYGGMWVANVFALRSTDPTALYRSVDPVSEPGQPDRNDDTIIRLAREASFIVCAWGAHGHYLQRGRRVAYVLRDHRLHALHVTKGHHPGHPLYLKNETKPVHWLP